jgi:hypothetical protein
MFGSLTIVVLETKMPIPFHAGHKLAWLEQVAADRNASDFQVRVAISVTRRTDRSGVAIAGQESIAGFINASSRGVRNALRGLAELEHIDRQDEGVGGRGVVGKYSLLSKQACTAEGKIDQTRSGITRNEQTGPDKTRNSESENAEQQLTKAGNCVPTESCSSIDSLKESSDDHQAAVSFEWEQVLQSAMSRYGADVFVSWFSKLSAEHVENEVGIVAAQTKFIADHVRSQYGDEILAWWKLQRSSLLSIRFTVSEASR